MFYGSQKESDFDAMCCNRLLRVLNCLNCLLLVLLSLLLQTVLISGPSLTYCCFQNTYIHTVSAIRTFKNFRFGLFSEVFI